MNAAVKKYDAVAGDIFGKKDPIKEHALKKAIAHGMDLKIFKKSPEEKKEKEFPKITIKPKEKKKSENTLGLIPLSYGEDD